MKKAKLFITSVFITAFCVVSQSQVYELWDNLQPGTYNVGFQRLYELDASRTYAIKYLPDVNEDTTLFERPMVINVWYPTNDTSSVFFKYEEYYTIEQPNDLWGNFLKRERDFNLALTRENSFYDYGQSVDQKALFGQLLSSHTAIRKDSRPANKKFPLVIYCPGTGGTVEESSLMCEFLASHGYVVASSLYQPNHVKHLYADWDLKRSADDRDFIIKMLSNKDFVDVSNIALMGFSFGAQSGFYYGLSKSSTIKAVVSLDSRLDYRDCSAPEEYRILRDTLFCDKKKLNMPMLCFSQPYSTYWFTDSLLFADRFYVRVPAMGHYDFTSQANLSHFLNYKADTTSIHFIEKWRLYKMICVNTLNFLNSQFGGSPFIFSNLIDDNNSDLECEHRKKGETHPRIDRATITKPIQLIRLIELYRFATVRENYPELLTNKQLASEELITEYGYTLYYSNVIHEAFEIFKWYAEMFPESSNAYYCLGLAYVSKNEKSNAISCFEKCLELNSDNREAKQRLNELIVTKK